MRLSDLKSIAQEAGNGDETSVAASRHESVFYPRRVLAMIELLEDAKGIVAMLKPLTYHANIEINSEAFRVMVYITRWLTKFEKEFSREED